MLTNWKTGLDIVLPGHEEAEGENEVGDEAEEPGRYQPRHMKHLLLEPWIKVMMRCF